MYSRFMSMLDIDTEWEPSSYTEEIHGPMYGGKTTWDYEAPTYKVTNKGYTTLSCGRPGRKT